MGYQLGTTALISKDNYNAFRIRCIMLILKTIETNHVDFLLLNYTYSNRYLI